MQREATLAADRFASRHSLGVILVILLVATTLRLWGLPGIPPGPHYDEAANGILAAEIADGLKSPVFIPSYTGKEVLFFYLAAAVMRLLGVGLLALRLTSALVGVITIAAAAWLAYELFANDDSVAAPWLAAATAALIATSFWHLLLSRVGFRAITQPLLQALTLAALWRGLRFSLRRDLTSLSVGWLLLSGFFCGLTGYTYLAARAFPVPLSVSLIALWVADRGRRRQRLIQFAIFGLAALVTFAPLGLYFVRHPDAFTARMSQVGPGGDWDTALNGVVVAFKMLVARGDPYIRFNLPFRPLFGPVVTLFFVVGLVVTVWRFLRPRETGASSALERAREVLLLAWIPVLLLPTALAVNEITPSNLRAIGLIPLIFLFPARGLWALLSLAHFRSRMIRYVPLLATCLLFAVTAFVTARAYFDEYVPRTDLYEASDGDLADVAAYLNQVDLAGTTVYVGSVHYRHPTLAFLADAYSQIKWLVGATTAVYPASGEALYLFPRSATPDADWLARALPGAVPVKAPAATDGAPAFTGFRVATPPQQEGGALAEFDDVVRLMSYHVHGAVSGARADVTVVWQILARSPYPDLIPFYHLEDPWGFRWGQAEPFQYAAEDWTPGETVVNRVQIPVAPGAPPGDYLLKTGFFSGRTGARLPVVDAADRFAGTTVPLMLTVSRAPTPPHLNTLEIQKRLDLETVAGPTLLGVTLDSVQARPGEQVHVTLFWQAHQDQVADPSGRHIDYSVQLSLHSVPGGDIALYDGAPVHSTYPASLWRDGEIVVDRYNPRLPLTTAETPPGEYPLALTLAAPGGEVLLGPVILGELTVIATDRAFDVPAITHPQRATLSDQIELLGYETDLSNARPGGTIRLILFWRALTEMDSAYTVFTHLLGPDGQVMAQQDNPPINGTYPTTLWLPGEVITDPYEISLSSDLQPGTYPIEVGFYIAENGLRLADPVLLDTTITVQP